jgi:hypothetical protein
MISPDVSSPCERRLNREISPSPATLLPYPQFGLRPVALRLTLSDDLPFRSIFKERQSRLLGSPAANATSMPQDPILEFGACCACSFLLIE